jgi:3-hydroxyacyl-[acyl-carrier-protein] dehydratase
MTMRAAIAAARISGPTPAADGTAILEFCFRPDDPTFGGHFPSQPLVPGVFQIEMARLAAEAVHNDSFTIREITKAKFLRPIIPTEIVRVELKLSPQADTIQALARLSVGGRPAGEVRLQLARNP